MKEEWKKVKLGEICEYVTSGGTPLASREDYYNPGTIPWLKTKEVNYCRITETENYISEKGLNNSSAKIIPENSVIMAMYGQGDTAGRVAINKIPLTTNQACCNLIINKEKADYNFVYYKLSTIYDTIVALKSGGAQPNLNAGKVKGLEITLPPLPTQQKIASILSAYDDLIENNHKQIKLLEEAALKLYKEWFVKLNFPGHETTKIADGVPDGWKKGKLSDLGEFKRGKTITKDQTLSGSVPVVAGGLEPAYYHNEFNTESPVITVSGSGANAGFTRMYNERVWASDCSFLDSSKCDCLFFIYCVLKSSTAIVDSLQKGAAQPHVYAKDINALEILIPNKDILEKFEKLTKPYFNKIKNCQLSIVNLQLARDKLLPKLMNGEIEV